MSKSINFLGIGDLAVDNFIELKDVHLNCNINNQNCELCFKFGQKVPYEKMTLVEATGNSSNVSVCASRLGLKTALVSAIGDDEYGKDCLGVLKKEGVKTKFISKDKKGRPTNYHFVLSYNAERTILTKHSDFEEYNLPTSKYKVDWVYLSSIGEHAGHIHFDVVNWLRERPDTRLAFQPGTFQIKLGVEKLKDIYLRTEILFCNKEEAQMILNTEESDSKKLLEGIHNLGPKKVVITDSRNGLTAMDENGFYFLPIYPEKNPPVELTGAGDALSGTVTAMIALGLPFKDALLYGPVNAMSVIQEIGPQKGLINKAEIEKYLKEPLENYKISNL